MSFTDLLESERTKAAMPRPAADEGFARSVRMFEGALADLEVLEELAPKTLTRGR